MKHPIIDQPSLLTRKHRQISIFFTLVFWALWFSLWVPVINLGAWLLSGQELFWSPISIFPSRHQLLLMVSWHVLVICLIPLTLGLWVLYNLMKFGSRERRTSQLPISRTEIAGHFGVDEKELSRWQKGKRLIVSMDEEGNITRVRMGYSGKET